MPLGLEGAAELGGQVVRAPGHDHSLHGRVGEDFLRIGDAPGAGRPTAQVGVGGGGVGRQLVPAAGRKGGGRRPAVGVVPQKRETHASPTFWRTAGVSRLV